eukprot:12939500-Alexandrium_andersonii.AAC.1
MSASLVGSEMCIRDSPTLGLISAGEIPIPMPMMLALRLWRWHAASAVSYTHLTLPTICSV